MSRTFEYTVIGILLSIPIMIVVVIFLNVTAQQRASDTCTDLGYVRGSPLRNDCIEALTPGRYYTTINPKLIKPADLE
jgi:hypothetical protein